jgi:glutathione synthase/RimK-type ligase-like ATP-grasp enzyme
MMHVIVRTGSGKKFARRIGQELKRINHRNNWIMPSVSYFPTSFERRPHLNPRNTLIHSRAAYPNGPNWVRNLVRKEEEGFRVINNTEVLRLTSDKSRCAIKMYNEGLSHPKTWEYDRVTGNTNLDAIVRHVQENGNDKIVVKPYTSMNQGADVEVISGLRSNTQCTCSHCGDVHSRMVIDSREIREAIRRQPTNKVVIQEYVDYTAIYRVVVINGRALPISWVDRPTTERWKVSVCLNRNMQFVSSPDTELLRVAERTQRVIEGEINFIDVFETRNGYVLSEINTACNLLLHEEKARSAGSTYWNIARYIAKYLDEQARRV